MNWVCASPEETTKAIAARLSELLNQQHVTWVISGGSNIALETEIILRLQKSAPLQSLTALLADERFGKVGHSDSNWQQLAQAGFMIEGPRYIAPFTDSEVTLQQAQDRYEQILEETLRNTSYTFAQLGMGPDGHTAGILPSTSAALQSDGLATAYVHEPYERLTMTFQALLGLDEVALVAHGPAKWEKLELLDSDVDRSVLPIKILTDIPKVTIYTDYQKN